MERGVLLRYPEPGWAREVFAGLFPGGHAVVFGPFRTAFEAENEGFEVRDCLIALGPTRHKVWLLRKPIETSNVAAQVLKTETGAIWIDGCRIPSGPSEGGEVSGSNAFGQDSGWNAHNNRPTNIDRMMGNGRWPPNFLLVHFPECRNVGTKRVPATSIAKSSPSTAIRRSGVHSEAKGHQTVGRVQPVTGHADDDGTEVVVAWDCTPGCYAAALDEQTGTLKSGPTKPGYVRQNKSTEGNRVAYHGGFGDDPLTGYGDEGGASRFFPQFKDESELDRWLLRLILGPMPQAQREEALPIETSF